MASTRLHVLYVFNKLRLRRRLTLTLIVFMGRLLILLCHVLELIFAYVVYTIFIKVLSGSFTGYLSIDR